MLKALEIVGFKSFADKTRFDFPAGITVIVGPNGSGKSNIVDAIKWVLGEQSVKSLRGKEMADVIFNGSGTRRAMNSAEITLTFNNSDGRLALETDEVHITRRIYRSGEGEYLINRQPSRLRDIRDLLAGTGLGTQAYSVIEQGKVDVLLQSSARDRRMIFEEAAGISRFKAKKIEALRRLERVEQNLLRLSDIVDEVENRLRSVRSQAGKARRYKEHSDRLQELRTQVALVDWSRLTARLAEVESDRKALEQQRDAGAAEIEAVEAALLETEVAISDQAEQVRQSEAQVAAYREQIAAAESTIEHQRARTDDLEQEVARHRRQIAALNVRAGDVKLQLHETGAGVETAEQEHRQIARRVAEGERRLGDLLEQLDQLRGESQQRRSAHVEQMRLVAALDNEISRLESLVSAAQAASERYRQRLDQLTVQRQSLAADLEHLRREETDLARTIQERADRLIAAENRLAERREQAAANQTQLAQLQRRQTAMAERISVLQELEQRSEGLSPGVREVLKQARVGSVPPLREVCGLVADLVQVSVEAAPVVEVALGELAQHVVARRSRELLAYLASDSSRFPGRVGFVWLEGLPGGPGLPETDLHGLPGVVGRCDRFVESQPEFALLVRRLLGRTWVVETLHHALALSETSGRGCAFVTLAGELLAADQSLSIGPRQAGTGLISRRSELRELKSQLADLDARTAHHQEVADRLRQDLNDDQRRVREAASGHQQASDALGEHRHRITAAVERSVQLEEQSGGLESELSASQAQYDSACLAMEDTRAQRTINEQALAEIEAFQAALAERVQRLEAEWQDGNRSTIETKVELAKSEQRLQNLRARKRQFEESQQERQRAIAEARDELAACHRRAQQSQGEILRCESEIAELYLRKEHFAARTVELIGQREQSQQERLRLGAEAQRERNRVRKLEEKIHARQLSANEIQHERTTLSDRLREDYGIELAELDREPTQEEQHQQEAVQQEIDELRRKINHLGNVNLEALEEIDQLESRYGTLAGQYKDLVGAKNSLQRIIEKINTDSRQLFADTLQTVKGHFQTLFRSLFGGGQADIILEDDSDILESGIEIVARPPGKEPRSITLLSGGEKTLTCTALLLAIFRSRPSPFCVLDEVDAALDEANIDRFTKVLHEFLAWTQFVIVTHSKKTMTCANTIYGVTMQESGISKQVSVRFEDVSDNGEILLPPQHATADAPHPAGEQDETQAA